MGMSFYALTEEPTVPQIVSFKNATHGSIVPIAGGSGSSATGPQYALRKNVRGGVALHLVQLGLLSASFASVSCLSFGAGPMRFATDKRRMVTGLTRFTCSWRGPT